jgi:hypothetical protein
MVSTTKNMTAYKIFIGLWDKITCLNGVINPEGINDLENELSSMCTIIKTHHFTEGQKYGHLASIIPQNKYRIVIGDQRGCTWYQMTPVPTQPKRLAWEMWQSKANSL